MSHLRTAYEQFVQEGFDPLGAIVMVIDGFPQEERFQPTVELMEEIGYERSETLEVEPGQYSLRTVGGQSDEHALPSFLIRFLIGKQLIEYQPFNRFILRGKSCLPHRPESDFCFADWYPVESKSKTQRKKNIEDQIADDFPNAASAAQFLHEQGVHRSNTYKRLKPNTYFVAARLGDGQPSGIVYRGDRETLFYDFYADERYLMGATGLLKEHRPTQRQLQGAMSLAAHQLPALPPVAKPPSPRDEPGDDVSPPF